MQPHHVSLPSRPENGIGDPRTQQRSQDPLVHAVNISPNGFCHSSETPRLHYNAERREYMVTGSGSDSSIAQALDDEVKICFKVSDIRHVNGFGGRNYEIRYRSHRRAGWSESLTLFFDGAGAVIEFIDRSRGEAGL